MLSSAPFPSSGPRMTVVQDVAKRLASFCFPTVGLSANEVLMQVIKAYETEGFSMLQKAFNDTKFLENLTGLDKLHDEGEAALEAVDWDEDDDEL